MKKNVGSLDKTLRIIIGIVVLGIGIYYKSWFGLIGLVPIITALTGWCPAYTVCGLSSCKTKEK